jgi:hypothetical protein
MNKKDTAIKYLAARNLLKSTVNSLPDPCFSNEEIEIMRIQLDSRDIEKIKTLIRLVGYLPSSASP